MLYGALFLIAGTALLAITYGLVAETAPRRRRGRSSSVARTSGGKLPALPPGIKAVINTRPRAARRSIYEQKTPSQGVVGIQAYAGQVSATFKRLTAAQAAQLHAVQAKAQAGIDQVTRDSSPRCSRAKESRWGSWPWPRSDWAG